MKTKLDDVKFADAEFKKAIRISTDTLGEDLMKQPSVYWKFGKIVAFAQKIASDTEARVAYMLKQEKITLAEEKNAAKDTVKTDKAAEAVALTSKNYRLALNDLDKARAEHNIATYEANLMQFAERCMRQRADLLKSLAFLEAGGLRVEGGSEIHRHTHEQVEDLEREAQQVFEKLNRTERGTK